MFYDHEQPIDRYKNYNDELAKIKGELSDNDARISLVKFLRQNLGFTYELLTGIDLHPVQEIMLKHMFIRDKGLMVAGRGSGKCGWYNHHTIVSTSTDKLISLPDLIPNLEFKDEEYILDIPPVKLWNGNSYQETSKILVQKDKDCMKVKTKAGYYFHGSTNHKIKVFDKEVGDIVWKRYHALDPKNDLVCISKNNIPEDVTPQQNELLKAYTHGCNFNNLTRIPQYILRNKYLVIQFLIGAFKNNYINTQNELLAQQIHLCLLTLGKVSKLYKEDDSFIIEYNKDKILLTEEVDTSFFFDPIDSIETFKGNCIDFMDIPDGACYWGNGFINHNSFLISIFCTLYPLFYPNTKICIISANFRSARRILEEAEKIVNGRKAGLLKECFPNEMRRSNDAWRWKIEENGCQISALPLGNNEGLRGERASVVLVDEGLLINEEIQKFIIEPFLASKLNFTDQKAIIKREQYLIDVGELKEEDRTIFPPNKYFVFSSSSYQFEYLYTMYKDYIKYTQKKPEPLDTGDDIDKFFKSPEYFVMRLAYTVFKKGSHMDLATIEGIKAEGGEESESFKREYMAAFLDSNSSFFNIKKMVECTVQDGQYPCVRLKGDPNKEYIMSIDPSFSETEDSDFFAIGIYEIDLEEDKIYLVNSYARAGGDLKEHHEYMAYLLVNFNIVFLIYDAQGGEIISGFNESKTAQDNNINLKEMEVKFGKMYEDEYNEEVRKAKDQYDLHNQKIVYGQSFTGDTVRMMNDYLQTCINFKRVWFASRLYNNPKEFKKLVHFEMPIDTFDTFGHKMDGGDYVAYQDSLIQLTKDQTSQIKVKISAKGSQSFDLPPEVTRTKSKFRPRKDNYTALLLANWGFKCYKSIISDEEEESNPAFTPFIM